MEYDIFPKIRERRLRKNQKIRDLVAEVSLNKNNLIQPIFIYPGENDVEEIKSMPGVYRMTIDRSLKFIGEGLASGINAYLLFGIPSHKDEMGTEAYDEEGIIPKAVRVIKKEYPDAVIIADVCM